LASPGHLRIRQHQKSNRRTTTMNYSHTLHPLTITLHSLHIRV